MLKLSWALLNERNFVNGILNLSKANNIDPKTGYRAGRIFQAAVKEMEKANKIEQEVKKKHFKPKPELPEGAQGQHTPDEWVEGGQEAFAKEFQQVLEENHVSIKVHKLDFNECKGLNGLELTALEPILDNVPEM